MNAETTPEVRRGSSDALRMISGLRTILPPVPVRPAGGPITAPAGELISRDGGMVWRSASIFGSHSSRSAAAQNPDQRIVIDFGQMDAAANECRRRGRQREGTDQLPICQSVSLGAPGTKSRDEKVQRQRFRLARLKREGKQRHRRDIGGCAAVTDARIESGGKCEEQAKCDDCRVVHKHLI